MGNRTGIQSRAVGVFLSHWPVQRDRKEGQSGDRRSVNTTGKRMTDSRQPLRPDVGVLALVPDRLRPPYMPRHQILARLSRYYHVAWLEPPQEWREIWLEGDLGTGRETSDMASAPGFHHVVPGRWLPKLYKPAFVASLLDRLRVRRAAGVLRKEGCSRLVLYLWRPQFVYALDAVDFDLSLYHVDDDYSFSDREQPVSSRERRLLTETDGVFLHSPALWERLSHLNPQSVYLPNGVDYESFATAVPEPPDLREIDRPRVGYVGIVKKQLDLQLLGEIANRRPDWSLVMVGPRGNLAGKEEQCQRLESRPNVHFLGPKAPEETRGYMQHLDVCVLPYEINDYTKYINPLKMYEYLAAGRPVVGVPLPAILEFSEVVAVASSVDGWLNALAGAMERTPTMDEAIAERRAVARRYDWRALTRRVADTMAERLGLELPPAAS